MDAQIEKEKVKDLTVGKPWKVLLAFTLPIIISQLFQQLYNTADTFIVGRFLGTEALAAVSSSGPIINLLTSFFVGTSTGAGIVVSRYFGEKNENKVSRAIHTNVLFGFVCGIILSVIGVVFTPFILRLINIDEEVLPLSIEYFRFYFLGAVSLNMYNVCRGIMTALGDSKRPLYYLIFSSVLNIVLDVLFVGVFGFGVWSAAVATTVSQTMSVILCFFHLCKKGKIYSVYFKKLKIHRDMFIEIIEYGVPSGIQNSVIGLANVIVESQINSFGKYAMAGYGSYAKIEGFVFLPITSFALAIPTYISQNLGANKKERAKVGARFGILSSMITAEVIGVLLFFFAPKLITIFDDTKEVVEYGTLQAKICSLGFCLLAFSHSVAAICRGAGRAFVPMAVMILCWCVIRTIYIFTVMRIFGDIKFIFMAYPITWTLSSIIYAVYYFTSKWEEGFSVKKYE